MQTRRMARAIADASDVAGESPTTKKDDSEASSVKEYATVDPIFREPSPRGSEVFFASMPDRVFNHMASFAKLKEFGKFHHGLPLKAVSCALGEQLAPERTPRKATL